MSNLNQDPHSGDELADINFADEFNAMFDSDAEDGVDAAPAEDIYSFEEPECDLATGAEARQAGRHIGAYFAAADHPVDTSPEDDPCVDIDTLPVALRVEAGRAELSVAEVRALCAGALIELDLPAQRYVTLLANGKPFATGILVSIEAGTAIQLVEMK